MNALTDSVSLRGIILRYLAIILFFALAGVLIMALMGGYTSRETLQRHESFELKVLSQDISNLVGFYRRIAEAYARRQEVADILVFNDIERAVIWAEEVRAFLPESIGVALVEPEGRVLGEPMQLRLGKQCESDLQQMLVGKDISQPAVHREQKSMYHFDITVPVKSQGEVHGLVFMSFSLDILQHRLNELVGDRQYLQLVDGTGVMIAEAGNPRFREGSEEYPLAAIAGTDWHMRSKGYEAGHGHLFLLATALGVVLFVVVIMLALYFSSRLLGLMIGDLNQIKNLLDSVHRGADTTLPSHKVRLRETALIMEDVSQLVKGIEQANRSLKQESTHDPLTGLYNRRAFDEELARQAGLAARGAEARLVLLDLDHFKPVNDRYGHSVGDEVLVAFSQTLHERCRSSDVLSRLGGDEFALIMPGGRGDIELWFHDVVELFMQKQRTLNGGEGVEPSCGVSAGSVTLNEASVRDVKTLMQQADEKLYQAKGAGRGQIIH